MYISQRYVCFYSWVFGNEEKIVIPIASIDSITKEDVMLIDTALCINIKNGRSYFFASYLHRDDCYNLINSLMKPQHRSNDAEERAWTFKTSDSDASHPHIQQQALQRATTHLNFGQARPQVALNDETGGMEIIKTSFPLTSCQFYNLFLTNHAPFSLVKYHEQKDDKEIQVRGCMV